MLFYAVQHTRPFQRSRITKPNQHVSTMLDDDDDAATTTTQYIFNTSLPAVRVHCTQ